MFGWILSSCGLTEFYIIQTDFLFSILIFIRNHKAATVGVLTAPGDWSAISHMQQLTKALRHFGPTAKENSRVKYSFADTAETQGLYVRNDDNNFVVVENTNSNPFELRYTLN